LPTQRELHGGLFCLLHTRIKAQNNATDQAAGLYGYTSACRLYWMHTGTQQLERVLN